jgi:hypothetical protein
MPAMVPPPPVPAFIPPPPRSDPVEPPPKKVKINGDPSLLSAEEFIAHSKEKTVKLSVEIPNEPNKEKWSLNGQILHIELSVTDTILHLKEILEGMLAGMKPNRQKLSTVQGMVLKDQSTFADYNLAGNVGIHLKVKERGGKK